MKLSVHLRKVPTDNHWSNIVGHLETVYGGGLPALTWASGSGVVVDRVYVGDEFCPFRLPRPLDMERFCRFFATGGIPVTLLLPVLTDTGIDRCAALFKSLETWHPEAEVVVNDLGTLFHLRVNHIGFRLSMGRLFNKGFKDPRLKLNGEEVTPGIRRLLSDSTYDQELFKEITNRLGVNRLERDLMPHGDSFPENPLGCQTSYYFPFGYITTGRVCRIAALGNKKAGEFGMLKKCEKPCEKISFRLENAAVPFHLFQAGNTVFYRYPPDRLAGLMERAANRNYRLVYQGHAI